MWSSLRIGTVTERLKRKSKTGSVKDKPRKNFNRPPGRCSSINPARMLIAFNKPFGVVSQFTADGSPHRTLADFGFPAGVYPLGRLDADRAGPLLLSDGPKLN